ncbi:MAG: tetratricopeptide repeat protein, partial [Desulfobacterales bacterium]|nr:tetratricopeptide repeat protein [Desulfobacterales bacterium]
MPPRMDMPDFQVSLPGSSRAVNAEELFDIQQQADFFISLGQYDQAIEVLKNHISDNVETSALAYLDLLKIYHTLDRRDDYDALREDFNKVFNAQVPEFENFSNQSSGLEAYQSALSRIEALWPSPKVLEIIEESIFRKPGSGDGEAFDLEAYRELLLLYAMAKDVVDRRSDMMDFDLSGEGAMADRDEPVPATDFSATNIQPLSALIPRAAPSGGPRHSTLGALSIERSAASAPVTRTRDVSHDDRFLEDSTPTDSVPGESMIDIAFPDIAMPRPSPRLGLDIDLSDEGMADLSLADMPAPYDASSDMPHVPLGVEIEMDPDFPFEPPVEAPPQNKVADSHLLDFDLFDAATER